MTVTNLWCTGANWLTSGHQGCGDWEAQTLQALNSPDDGSGERAAPAGQQLHMAWLMAALSAQQLGRGHGGSRRCVR